MGATLSKVFYNPTVEGSTLKGKNLLLKGANSFLLEKTPFSNWLRVQESKQAVRIFAFVRKNGGKTCVFSPLKRLNVTI